MPYRVRYDPGIDCVVTKITGDMDKALVSAFFTDVGRTSAENGCRRILSDLTDAHKPIGKSLAGRAAFLIGTGGSPKPPASFEAPFADTAGYFNMYWGGLYYEQGARIDPAAAAACAFTGGACTSATGTLSFAVVGAKELGGSGWHSRHLPR